MHMRMQVEIEPLRAGFVLRAKLTLRDVLVSRRSEVVDPRDIGPGEVGR